MNLGRTPYKRLRADLSALERPAFLGKKGLTMQWPRRVRGARRGHYGVCTGWPA